MSAIKFDGKKIAQDILLDLKTTVKERHLAPALAVILVGSNPASLSFIKQKQTAAEFIGATLDTIQLPETISEQEFITTIKKYNKNKKYQGIIIQRPIPPKTQIRKEVLLVLAKEKDVDGFCPDSPFDPPVARAVITILEHIYTQHVPDHTQPFTLWLRGQTIAVIGKGETAGLPIYTALEKLGQPVILIDRATKNPYALMKKAHILISCVGKEGFIVGKMIQNGAILISVGLCRGEDGRLHGDFEEEDVTDQALAFTPSPGGVGPVNVACLMQNLVTACKA